MPRVASSDPLTLPNHWCLLLHSKGGPSWPIDTCQLRVTVSAVSMLGASKTHLVLINGVHELVLQLVDGQTLPAAP